MKHNSYSGMPQNASFNLCSQKTRGIGATSPADSSVNVRYLVLDGKRAPVTDGVLRGNKRTLEGGHPTVHVRMPFFLSFLFVTPIVPIRVRIS